MENRPKSNALENLTKSDESSDLAFKFLYINLDYFSAPFVDTQSFQEWAKRYKLQVEPLSKALEEALDANPDCPFMQAHAQFRNAICGDEPLDIKVNKIVPFLKKNPAVIKALNNHVKNSMPIINSWYQEKSTAEQKNKRQERLSEVKVLILKEDQNKTTKRKREHGINDIKQKTEKNKYQNKKQTTKHKHPNDALFRQATMNTPSTSAQKVRPLPPGTVIHYNKK